MNTNSISITKIILLFYVLLNTSLLQPLLSKQWTKTVKNNRLIQHIIGFTTILTISTLIAGENEEYSNLILYTVLGYLWFIFSTKMDIHLNIIIVILLLANYMYGNYLSNENKKIKNDNILTREEKDFLINKNLQKDTYIMFILMACIVGGMFIYSNKKEIQYGGGKYNFVNFLLY